VGTTHAVRDIFIEANGLRHHLIARGSPGTPVVMMIHGLAGQAHVFDVIANRLAAKYHVYCLDVRGRGESAWGPANEYGFDTYVADLEAIRDGLGLHRMSLVGTSMGGLISIQYGAKFPERVERAVINDVGPEIDPQGLQRILSYVTGAPEMFADMKSVIRYYKEHYAPMVEHLPDDQIADFARYNVRKSDSGVYVWKMDPAVRAAAAPPPATEPWDAWKALTCPVLLLRGANSDVLSPSVAARMIEEQPSTKLVEIPNVGHAPILSEPESVRALEEFLGG
jgi:pimeloyl-ACP methyl ester carboxylesterase